MKIQQVCPNYLQIADMIHRLSPQEKEKLFIKIGVLETKDMPTTEKNPDYEQEKEAFFMSSRKAMASKIEKYLD
ncbi:MAG: hypothetical protein LBQ31_03635 [Bacteroidales bacterium]|jgi:hypothetical protein|nr:hypothetical protein [Bacteroidales bacterium]